VACGCAVWIAATLALSFFPVSLLLGRGSLAMTRTGHLWAQAEPTEHRPAELAIDVLATSDLGNPARHTSAIPHPAVGMRLGKRGA